MGNRKSVTATIMLLCLVGTFSGCSDASEAGKTEKLAREKAQAERMLQEGAKLISSTRVAIKGGQEQVIQVVTVPVPSVTGLARARHCVIIHALTTVMDCSDPEVIIPE
ncbi:hypothetical protein D3C78_1030430 [compost metagenome]